MSAKQLLRLAAVFCVLLLVWAAAALARRRETVPNGGDALRLVPIRRAAVDTVVLARPGDTTVLARRDTTTWTVNGQPASRQAITDLLNVLTDSAPESELVAQRRTSQAGLGVDSATGTRVRVKAGARTLADLVVGHRSQDYSGGYLRLANQEPTYLVRGRLVETLNLRSDDWRDHRIAAVPAESVATMEISRGNRRYALRRTGGAWSFSPGGVADSSQAANLLTAYSSVNASGFASRAQADSAHFASPDRRVRLLRKNGTPLLALVFDSTSAGFWVRPDTSSIIYRIDTGTADRLAPADSTLRGKKRANSTK